MKSHIKTDTKDVRPYMYSEGKMTPFSFSSIPFFLFFFSYTQSVSSGAPFDFAWFVKVLMVLIIIGASPSTSHENH